MKAIIGLGNFGKGYDNTYHNLGFKVVDDLAKKLKVKFDLEKCKSKIAKAEIGGEEVIIAKPTTFMNASGQAVDEICRKFKIKVKDVFVVCDDIDLDCGVYRFRTSGSAGTHNGLRDIVRVIGKEEFNRVRLGCGYDRSVPLRDFVLSPIDPHKKELLAKVIDSASNFLLEQITKPATELVNSSFRIE